MLYFCMPPIFWLDNCLDGVILASGGFELMIIYSNDFNRIVTSCAEHNCMVLYLVRLDSSLDVK